MSLFTYCTQHSPCEVCGAKQNCRRNSSGLHFCRYRHDGDWAPGMAYLGESKDGLWGLYKHEGAAYSCASPTSPAAPRPLPDPAEAERERRRAAWMFESSTERSRPLDGDAAARLAKSLGLPADFLAMHFRRFPDDGQGELFVLPEYNFDAQGDFRPVCYLWRSLDGTKRNHGDPDAPVKRGLTLLDGWDERPGPIYFPEGASDTLALHAMGLCAAGRPSSRGGHETAARMLAMRPDLAERELIVLGENDQKPNGRWEGRDGARAFAQQLADLTGRPVRIAMAPEGSKDVRDWFRSRWKPVADPRQLGADFEREVRQFREVIRPQSQAHQPDTYTNLIRRLALSMAAALRDNVGERAREEEGTREAVAQAVALARADRVRYRCACCRKLVLRDRETFTPYVATVRCQGWLCEGCRRWLVLREMAACQCHFRGAEELYEFGCTQEQWPAMYARIDHAEAEYRRVRDGAGWYVVVSKPIRGVIPVTAEQASSTFQALLDEWDGDHRPVSSSHGWKLLDEEKAERLEVMGPVDDAFDGDKIAEIATEFQAAPVPRGGSPDRPRSVVSLWKIQRRTAWDDESSRRFAVRCFGGREIPPGATFEVDIPVRDPMRTSIEEDVALAAAG